MLKMQIELQKQIVKRQKEKRQNDRKTLMLLEDKQKLMQKLLKMLELQKMQRNKKN